MIVQRVVNELNNVLIDEGRQRTGSKLFILSKKSIDQVPQTNRPTYEQMMWLCFKLSHPEAWPPRHTNK
jgi:hypothetical protein